MKKITSAIIAFLCAALFSVCAFGASETSIAASTEVPQITEISEIIVPSVTASEEDNNGEVGSAHASLVNMSDLYGQWQGEYPEYVCGVWSTDGTMDNLTVAVTKDEKGEAGIKEILSLIENDNSVSFTYMAYSYAELRDVQDEVTIDLKKITEQGIVSSWGIGVEEMANCVTVDIDTSSEEVQSFITKCFEKYGNRIKFNDGSVFLETNIGVADGEYAAGDDAYTYTEEIGSTASVTAVSVTADEKSNDLLILTAWGTVLVIFTGIGIFAARRVRLKATNAGNITENTALSQGQVEEILRTATEEPQRDILGEVMEEIGKE